MAAITSEQLPQMVAALSCHHDAPILQIKAVTQLRKLLSLEVNAPIAEAIAAGVVPRLVQFLTHDQLPQLQFEAAWALTSIASSASEHTRVVVEAGAVPLFFQLMRSPNEEVREQASWALGNLAGDSHQYRDYILQQGAMPALLQAVGESTKLSMLRNAAWTISNLCRGKPAPSYELVSPALPVLARLLHSTDEELLADACWALSYLSNGPNERIQAVIEAGVCRRLVELLASGSFAIQTPALRIIGKVATGDDMQTQVILNLSILGVLPSLLNSIKKNIRKEACWTLSNITAGNTSHIQAVIEANLFPHLVALLGQADVQVAVQAAWAISNATSGSTPEQVRYLVEQAGCLRPLCAVLGCGGDKIIAVVLEALHNILSIGAREAGASGSGSNRYAMYITQLGVVDKVVQLQSHSNDDIRDKAVHLLGVLRPGGASTNDDTGRPAWDRAGQRASSNVFSFGTFHAALP